MFFDIGMGLILTTLFGMTVLKEPSATFVAVGVVGSLWPDIDFIVWLLRGKKIDHLAHQHRDLLHRPLMLVPILTAIVWVWLGWQAGCLFAITSLAHFIHDTIGHAWGIRWLWPISDRYFCHRAYGDYPAQWRSWTRAEQDQLCDTYGNRQWMMQSYAAINSPLMVEFMVLGTGVVLILAWHITR